MLIVPVQLFYLLEIDKTHLGFRSLNSIFVDKVIPSGDLEKNTCSGKRKVYVSAYEQIAQALHTNTEKVLESQFRERQFQHIRSSRVCSTSLDSRYSCSKKLISTVVTQHHTGTNIMLITTVAIAG